MPFNNEILTEMERKFELKTGLNNIVWQIKERDSQSILIIEIANPTDRFYKILEKIRDEYSSDNSEKPLATIIKKSGSNLLQGAEGKLLLKTLSESLNINRYSFQDDFLSRYTKSVFGAEEQITSLANHIVYGRRGAGKSMLLLYALNTRSSIGKPSVWIDMQVYARRGDDGVISDVLRDLLEQTSVILKEENKHKELISQLQSPLSSMDSIRKLLPSIRRLLAQIAAQGNELFIFLDDFHVVTEELQPCLLDILYSISRGNRIFIKISAIETLTRTYEPDKKMGLEVHQDAQLIQLDYNLTTPDKATKHIETILGSHAIYCGLPSIRRLCTSADVIPRLTWVAAGVPRDALNLFAQAITKGTLQGRKHVSVSNVNIAASEAINSKLRDLDTDASEEAKKLQKLLDDIRDFCVKKQRRNAFLVEIKGDDPIYNKTRKLVDLRLLHVINEGITIGEAGRKYIGLVLDYGFYTGIRAARSVDLFNWQTQRVAYKELRKLPVFE